jgi:hypothetical protein
MAVIDRTILVHDAVAIVRWFRETGGMKAPMMVASALDRSCKGVAVGTCCRIERQPQVEQGAALGAVIVSIA